MKRLALVYLICLIGSLISTHYDKTPAVRPVIKFITHLVVSLVLVAIAVAATTALRVLIGQFD